MHLSRELARAFPRERAPARERQVCLVKVADIRFANYVDFVLVGRCV